jgi:hypothetical protein
MLAHIMDARWMKETPTEPLFDVMEVEPETRRALRRSLRLRCDVCSHYWDHAVPYQLTNVSPYGAWIDTLFPLHAGAELVLSFRPPWSGRRELTVFGEVKRVRTGRLRKDRGEIGMGIEFSDISNSDQKELTRALRGIPPRLNKYRWGSANLARV